MRAEPILEPGEYITEDPVPCYGPVQNTLFKAGLGPFVVLSIVFICYWLPKAFSQFRTNPALNGVPFYRLVGLIYVPLLVLLVLVSVYYLVSIYREKLMLTNRAILRRNVFSTDRIAFADITSVAMQYESFNLNQKGRLTSFILGLLLGVNWQLTIKADENRELTIRNMGKSYALALQTKLNAVRGRPTTP